MCVHIIFSSVSVAEWPPFGALVLSASVPCHCLSFTCNVAISMSFLLATHCCMVKQTTHMHGSDLQKDPIKGLRDTTETIYS